MEWTSEVALEFLAVGKALTAFLTGSVKGGELEVQAKKQLKSHPRSFRVLATKPNSKEIAQMASANTLCKKLLNVKGIVVEECDFYEDVAGVQHLDIQARPTRYAECRCPECGRKRPKDGLSVRKDRTWRSLDFGAIVVNIKGYTQRIKCPIHGSIVANVPWAYPGSRFTKDFDLTVGWLAVHLSKSAIAEYMRIDWETVGRCVSRTLHEIEPDRSRRLHGLVRIGIDETSYKKGHKYITVILNHDTNTVVWAAPGHGKSVLDRFFRSLTEEQRKSIQVVTGDGARWITDAIAEYCPNADRCVDPFHVVEWATEAVDEVRREAWREAYNEYKALDEAFPRGKGRPKLDDASSAMLSAAKKKATEIKRSSYTLGKAPENLTENQSIRLEMIAQQNPRLYRAYQSKEALRLLLKLDDVEEAEKELKSWFWRASHSRIPAICDLARKIRRHQKHILNTIRLGMSNARIEATNNKIKLIIRMAYGFRSISNMIDLIYLICSDLELPLPNRKRNSRLPA